VPRIHFMCAACGVGRRCRPARLRAPPLTLLLLVATPWQHRTTRVGTERHLLCIEDPFELSHDLGRTVHAGG
jgi:hypothetical protein